MLDPYPVANGVGASELLGWINEVASSFPWGGRRGLDRVAPGLESRLLRGRFAAALADDQGSVVAEARDGEPLAATTLSPKPLESGCFEVATAAISAVVAPLDLPDREEVIRRLLRSALARAEARHVVLLILRVDADDVEALAAAQAVGFRVCEATVTWLLDSREAPPAFTGSDVTVEVHEHHTGGVLTPDVVEALADRTAAWELNHFYADPRLPRDAVARFYRRWVHNIADGSWSDCLYVARRQGRIIGIHSEVTDREVLDRTGEHVRVAEWITTLEQGGDVGRALTAAAGSHRFLRGTFHSWETQVRNLATIRCIERTGHARPIRAGYTLHAWTR